MIQWKKVLASCAVAGAVLLAIPITVFAIKSLSAALEPNPPAKPTPISISAVQVTATLPKAGETPKSITVDGNDYSISSFQWIENGSPVPGRFEAGKQYSLEVELTANDNATFTTFTPSIPGAQTVTKAMTNHNNVGNKVSFAATFPELPGAVTPPPVVTGKKSYLSITGNTIHLLAPFSRAENILYEFGPKGPNSLFEFRDVCFVGAGLKGAEAVKDGGWMLFSSGTDFFGPYILEAKSNTVPGSTSTFTGGNHGYENSGDTSQGTKNTRTGRCISMKVFADGAEVSDGFSGYVDEVTFDWINGVQAWNTKKTDGSGREVMNEHYNMRFDGDTFHVSNEITFLEETKADCYYGLQIVSSWGTDIRYVDAKNSEWYPTNKSSDSGDKTCSSYICKLDKYNLQASIDPTVGIGNHQYLYGNNPSAFNLSYGKAYSHLFRDVPNFFKAGSTFNFEGSYRFFYGD